MTTKHTAEQKAEALAQLHEWLQPGDKVYSLVTHVSRSGMSRSIKFFIARANEIISLDWYLVRVLGLPFDRNNGGLKVSGCGMDMCFHTVYNLGRAMWPDGFPTPAGYWRNREFQPGETDPDGGYALKSSAF